VTGRPSIYTPELIDTICERITLGESMRSICRDEDMPAVSTIFKWLREVDGFSEQYTRAREQQADTYADEIVDIADETETVVKDMGGGTTAVVFDSTAVARNRLRMDARKWVAAKLKPKKYGDKQAIEHTGKDGGPIQTQTEVRPQLTREEWLATYVDAPARPAASSD
jgi:hypothetical protein